MRTEDDDLEEGGDDEGADGANDEGLCAHGVRDDNDCTDCRTAQCPGGGSCSCPHTPRMSARAKYRSTH